jgi:hypothetical protein
MKERIDMQQIYAKIQIMSIGVAENSELGWNLHRESTGAEPGDTGFTSPK